MFVYSFQLTPGYRYQISQSEHAAGVGAFFILRAIDFTRQLRMDGLPREQRRLVWPSGERLHVTPNARVVTTDDEAAASIGCGLAPLIRSHSMIAISRGWRGR